MKKLPILSLVLGILILVYAFLAYYLQNDVFNLTKTIGNIVVGAGLVAFSIFVVMPDIKKKSIALIKIVEFIILMFAAIFGFILPLLDINTFNLGGGSLWFGIALVMDGSINLYLGMNNKKSLKNGVFFISLLSVIFGTWVYATNFIDKNIRLFTFIVLLVVGFYLTVIGLLNTKKGR